MPPKLLNIIKNVYDNPTFYVYLQNAYSNYHTQQAGIRQGCPLSPYLFVMVMSALWQDIYQALPNTNAHEILYADDTLLYSRVHNKLNETLRAVETESYRYGLALNYDTCEFLGLNYGTAKAPKFTNGKHVKRVKKAKYLGAILTDKSQPQIEIAERIKQTTITWKRLNLIWKIGKCTTKTKLKYYNAVVKTKLTYALETMFLTKTQLRKLDTFQLKGLRQILKMHTTYIERANTNKEVRTRAADFLWPNKEKAKARDRIQKISKQVKQAQTTLFAHTLREEPTAPTRKATFKGNKARPNISSTKRVGRPRKNWTVQLMKRTWHTIRKDIPELRHKSFRKRSSTIQHWIHDAANLRLL